MASGSFELRDMAAITDEPLPAANPNQQVIMRIPFAAEQYDLIRREKCG
jgi:hypothetical protein